MPDDTQFSIGFTDPTNRVMVVFVPIQAYSENMDGTALLRGKFDEAKQIALMKIQELRQKKQQAGLIKPVNGSIPLNVA